MNATIFDQATKARAAYQFAFSDAKRHATSAAWQAASDAAHEVADLLPEGTNGRWQWRMLARQAGIAAQQMSALGR